MTFASNVPSPGPGPAKLNKGRPGTEATPRAYSIVVTPRQCTGSTLYKFTYVHAPLNRIIMHITAQDYQG